MGTTDFKERTLKIVAGIPSGKTLSYKQVAELAGSSRAYRVVGNLMKRNYDPNIPCHRVICSDGKPGGYNRGVKNKIAILKKERALVQRFCLYGNSRSFGGLPPHQRFWCGGLVLRRSESVG